MTAADYSIAMSFRSSMKFSELSIMALNFIKPFLGITDDDYFKVEISMREAITNAIVHGNHLDLNKFVTLTLRWDKSALRMWIKDENTEVKNFREIEEKINSCDLLSFNGRGITIMRSYMDKFEFTCTGQGNEVMLEKRLR